MIVGSGSSARGKVYVMFGLSLIVMVDSVVSFIGPGLHGVFYCSMISMQGGARPSCRIAAACCRSESPVQILRVSGRNGISSLSLPWMFL